MTISIMDFLKQIMTNPALMITVLLTLGVILVNGWTDAPNAIATCVSTRAMRPDKAILMAAVFNFLGVFVMTIINKNVAMTISTMVNFGGDAKVSTIALCAALFAIVVWAVAAWAFGIPTSESHALIAGLTGSAIALQNGLGGINGSAWLKVIWGLVLSTFLGFGLGYTIVKLVALLFKKSNRKDTNIKFKNAQIGGAAAMAFMHGAQDGQKFMGVFMLGFFMANGNISVTEFDIPIWLMILCSAVMGLGTSIGGYKIIKAVGMDMVKMETYEGFSADSAGALCLLLSSVTGLPVSTTHTKTTAIMGVGAAKRLSNVKWDTVKEMVLTWVLTFPGCGLISYIITLIFMRIF